MPKKYFEVAHFRSHAFGSDFVDVFAAEEDGRKDVRKGKEREREGKTKAKQKKAKKAKAKKKEANAYCSCSGIGTPQNRASFRGFQRP